MKEQYFAKMRPYAQRASDATGIPIEVILAQWGHESAYGTSSLAKRANNHAGIKSSSKGKDYVSGMYSGYDSLNSFARDYARVMGLSYYDKVRSATSVEETVKELDRSPYAEDKKYGEKLFGILKGMPNTKIQSNVLDQAQSKVASMDNDELIQYATVGIGALIIANLLKG